MTRNTAGVKNPVSNEEFAKIVARGEARLGTQFFFGGEVAPKAIVAPVEKPVEKPIEKVVEPPVAKIDKEAHRQRVHVSFASFVEDIEVENPYTDVFEQAVRQLQTVHEYKGSR